MSDYVCFGQDSEPLAGPGAEARQDFMDLRLRYVTEMGWRDGLESDADRYDANPDTHYFLRYRAADGGDSPLIAGLRATRVPSVYDSLTWSMLGGDAERQSGIIAEHLRLFTRINHAAATPDAGLWDITRLVSQLDGSATAAETLSSIYQLLGMVLYKSVVEPEADPVWMFLTTPTIKRMFEMSGIPCTVLFGGRVSPGDEDDAFLCVSEPKRAFNSIGHSSSPTHRRAFGQVLAGCTALAERPVVVAA